MAQPTLGGTTLPYFAADGGYVRDQILQGSVAQMASGKYVVDFVETGGTDYRTLYKVAWTMLTSSELTTVTGAYWAMVAAGTATFVSPENVSASVMPTKNVGMKISSEVVGGNVLRYNVSCEFQVV